MAQKIFKSDTFLGLFSASWVQVSSQGKPSCDSQGNCTYETDGLMCAVGACMTAPALKAVDNEALDVHGVILKLDQLWFDADIDADIADFLDELQDAHDNASQTDNFMESFRINMKELSDEHNLGVTYLEVGIAPEV